MSVASWGFGPGSSSWGEMRCPEHPGVGAWAGLWSRAEVGGAWTWSHEEPANPAWGALCYLGW